MRFFETTDYDDFVLIAGNREISQSNVDRFKRIIQEEGGVYDEVQVNPRKFNDKWAIVDGQHRFLAYKELGLPVPIVTKRVEVPLKGIIEMNTIRKAWTMPDRVKSYATLGNENYQRLYSIWQELNDLHRISIKTVAKLCQGTLSSSQQRGRAANLGGGDWKFKKSEAEVSKVFKECVKFTECHPDAMSDAFVHCIQSLMDKQPGFKIKRMLTAAKNHPHKFVRAARKQDMLRMLEELYNFNRPQSSRLYFDMNNL